jgi:hypothetical protein
MKDKEMIQTATHPTTHDFCYFYGDFNYRINLGRGEVLSLIYSQNIQPLISNDQLFIEKKKKTSFEGFEEDTITFNPTYKFDKWSTVYDTGKKQRVPLY